MSAVLQEDVWFKRPGGIKSTSMLPPKVDDTEETIELPNSYFPCLDSRPGKNSNWQSNEVPFKDSTRLQSFCKEQDVSSLSVFQAAWALVLRCYLGTPSVCFASESIEETGDAEQISRPQPIVDICLVELGQATSIRDVLNGAHTKYVRSSKAKPSMYERCSVPDALPMNTSLVVRGADSRDWSGAVRPAIHSCRIIGRNDVWNMLPHVCFHRGAITDDVPRLRSRCMLISLKTTS